MKIHRLFLIGAGGIGSHLLAPLSKLLIYHPDGTFNITVVDGDSYTIENGERQLFDYDYIGKNKAEAIIKGLSYMPSLRYIPEYINEENIHHILTNYNTPDFVNCIISAVDNLATRKLIITKLQSLYEEQSYNFVYINCGNSLDTAHLSVWALLRGRQFFLNPLERYLNIANPDDRIPGRCSEQEPSTPQLVTANNMASHLVLMTLQNILDNSPVAEEINGSLRKQVVKSIGTRLTLN